MSLQCRDRMHCGVHLVQIIDIFPVFRLLLPRSEGRWHNNRHKPLPSHYICLSPVRKPLELVLQ
jgi:hypothetical protein